MLVGRRDDIAKVHPAPRPTPVPETIKTENERLFENADLGRFTKHIKLPDDQPYITKYHTHVRVVPWTTIHTAQKEYELAVGKRIGVLNFANPHTRGIYFVSLVSSSI